MKYIKLFENEYYEINSREWEDFKILYFTIDETIKIMEVFKKLNIINDDQFYDIVDTLKNPVTDNTYLYHEDNIYIYLESIEIGEVSIYKGEDDYYYINPYIDGNNLFYKCDQLKGLINCIIFLSKQKV